MRSINKFAALSFTLAVLFVFTEKTVQAKLNKNRVSYHIIASTSGSNPIYTVVTNGLCIAGIKDCSFSTGLPPDQPGGKYSRAYLVANLVLVDLGNYHVQ